MFLNNYHYILLYTGITISISLVLSTCLLFISLMQLVNGAQLLNITLSLVLFAAAPAAAVLLTVLFPLASIYASLQSHKLDFNILVSNLISLLVLYIPLNSPFISTQFFVLNLGA